MSVKVVVCDVEPAVAVIVTVEVPAGVPVLPPVLDEPELPPHPANPRTATARTQTEASTSKRNAGFHSVAAHQAPSIASASNRTKTAASSKAGSVHRRSRIGENIALRAVVLIVSVVVAAAPLGVTVAGLNEHDADCGSPEHVKLVAAANPPDGVTVIVDVAELPAATVPLVGLDPNAKSPAPAVITTLTAFETEAGLLLSPG